MLHNLENSMEFIYKEVTVQISNLLMKRNRNKCLVGEGEEEDSPYGIKLESYLDLLLVKVNVTIGNYMFKRPLNYF